MAKKAKKAKKTAKKTAKKKKEVVVRRNLIASG